MIYQKYIKRFIHLKYIHFYHHIAIIGTGPSGFYTAKYCLDKAKQCNYQIKIDFFEKLPTPYGLVRYGVAPDHPEVKTVEETFKSIGNSCDVRFFGNLSIGSVTIDNNISMDDIIESYSAVVFAYGASADMSLNLPNEDHISGILSARKFVNWYNGHPCDQQILEHNNISLENIKHVVIVGQGNVALDCARILAKNVEELKETDISSIETITLIGRRGFIQSAFTIKEFRELTKLTNAVIDIDPDELVLGRNVTSMEELQDNRPKQRMIDLIESVSKNYTYNNNQQDISKRRIIFKYLLTPTEFITTQSSYINNNLKIKGLKLNRNILEGHVPYHQKAKLLSDASITIPCDLLLKSIGYRCTPISTKLPFDHHKHIIPNIKGRIISNQFNSHLSHTNITNNTQIANDTVVNGLYVTGWLKRGCTGIIASNIPDAKETSLSIYEDITNNKLKELSNDFLIEYNNNNNNNNNNIDVNNNNIDVNNNNNNKFIGPKMKWMSKLQNWDKYYISWESYQKIDQEEIKRGKLYQPIKIREKILDINELLKISKA